MSSPQESVGDEPDRELADVRTPLGSGCTTALGLLFVFFAVAAHLATWDSADEEPWSRAEGAILAHESSLRFERLFLGPHEEAAWAERLSEVAREYREHADRLASRGLASETRSDAVQELTARATILEGAAGRSIDPGEDELLQAIAEVFAEPSAARTPEEVAYLAEWIGWLEPGWVREEALLELYGERAPPEGDDLAGRSSGDRRMIRRAFGFGVVCLPLLLVALLSAGFVLTYRGSLNGPPSARPVDRRLHATAGVGLFVRAVPLYFGSMGLGYTFLPAPLGEFGMVLGLLAVAWLVSIKLGPRWWSVLGLGGPRGSRAWLVHAGLVGWVAMLAVDVPVAIWTWNEPSDPALHPLLGVTGPLDWIAVFTGAAVLAPLAEEFLFRGLLHTGLRSRLSFWPAALISGVAFSLVHGYPWLPSLGLVWSGVVLAWLLERTRSLWPAIVAHGVANGVLYALVTVLTDQPTG